MHGAVVHEAVVHEAVMHEAVVQKAVVHEAVMHAAVVLELWCMKLWCMEQRVDPSTTVCTYSTSTMRSTSLCGSGSFENPSSAADSFDSSRL